MNDIQFNDNYDTMINTIAEIQSKQDSFSFGHNLKEEFHENKLNKTDDEIICIICWDKNGIVKLCVNCKILYCIDCAIKVNKQCTICKRNIIFYDEYINDNFEFNIQLPLSITLFFRLIISLIFFLGLSYYCLMIIYLLCNYMLISMV